MKTIQTFKVITKNKLSLVKEIIDDEYLEKPEVRYFLSTPNLNIAFDEKEFQKLCIELRKQIKQPIKIKRK